MTRFEKWQDWMTNPKGLLFLVGVVLFVLAFGIFMWADPVPVPVRRYRIPGIHLGIVVGVPVFSLLGHLPRSQPSDNPRSAA